MKLRTPPVEPIRYRPYVWRMPKGCITAGVNETRCLALSDVLLWASKNSIPSTIISLELSEEPDADYVYAYSYASLEVHALVDREPDTEFEARMKVYNREKKNYNAWYEQNKEEIEETLENREQARVEKAQKTLASLKKKKEKLEKELAKVEKVLS